MTQLLVKIVERKLRESILRFTKKIVQLEHFIVLNVPTSHHVRKLISTLLLQKSIACPN